jgi:hypothetical protein
VIMFSNVNLEIRLAAIVVFCSLCGNFAGAQERLSMGVEWRHGKFGPKRTFTKAAPGETVRLFADVTGLVASKDGQQRVKFQAHLRNDENDLLQILMNDEVELKNVLGTGRIPFSESISIPLNYTGKTVRIVHSVRDLNSDREITHEYPIEIYQPIGAYPVNACYTHGFDGPSGSGRFTVGERVYVQFDLLGIEETKQAHCKLTTIASGAAIPELTLPVTVEVPEVRNIKDGLTIDFDFLAAKPFSGCVRLSVVDDAGNDNSIELPLVVTEALEKDQSVEAALKPSAAPESQKKAEKN